MKTIYRKGILVFSLFVILQGAGCSKDKNGNEDCRTCRAYGANPEPVATQEVCSDAAEQSFRNEFTGHEISCN